MTIGSNSEAELKALIERAERLEEEKAKISEDLKNVFLEAKVTGFDVKTMKRIIAERKIDMAERRERRAIFDHYAEKTKLYDDEEYLA